MNNFKMCKAPWVFGTTNILLKTLKQPFDYLLLYKLLYKVNPIKPRKKTCSKF